MNKQEILEKLCTLCSKVNSEVFEWDVASDCFCGQKDMGEFFMFDDDVFDFIKDAVEQKIKQHNKGD